MLRSEFQWMYTILDWQWRYKTRRLRRKQCPSDADSDCSDLASSRFHHEDIRQVESVEWQPRSAIYVSWTRWWHGFLDETKQGWPLIPYFSPILLFSSEIRISAVNRLAAGCTQVQSHISCPIIGTVIYKCGQDRTHSPRIRINTVFTCSWGNLFFYLNFPGVIGLFHY